MTEPFSILHMKNDITKLPDEEAMNYNWKKKKENNFTGTVGS